MHYSEGVQGAPPAALNPIGIPGKTKGTDIPRVEVGLVARSAVAQPQFVGLALLPVEVRLRLGLRRRDGRRRLGWLGHISLLGIVFGTGATIADLQGEDKHKRGTRQGVPRERS